MNAKMFLLLVTTLSAALGCATSASTEGARSNSNIITAEEIEAAQVSNLYDLVQRLRPRWLDVRSQRSFSATTEIVVYQGQTFLGGLEVLRELDKHAAHTLQYLDSIRASATLPGLGHRQVEGAIVINPRS